jgi:ribose 5-phosphate isomerase B
VSAPAAHVVASRAAEGDAAVIIAAGADHAGFAVKDVLVRRLRALGHEVVDVGAATDSQPDDYADFAHMVAEMIEEGRAGRGVLVCDTGIGVCMAANRHPGVRAANCLTPHHAEMARRRNDANVLCLGGRLMGADEAWAIAEVWLATPFEGGRHARRTAGIDRRAGTPR